MTPENENKWRSWFFDNGETATIFHGTVIDVDVFMEAIKLAQAEQRKRDADLAEYFTGTSFANDHYSLTNEELLELKQSYKIAKAIQDQKDLEK